METILPQERFSISEAWSVMLIFFDELWEFIEKNLSRDYKQEYIFFGLVNIDQECYQEWISCYEKSLLNNELKEKPLAPEEVILLIGEFVSFFHHQRGLDLSLLMKFLDEMNSVPKKCPTFPLLFKEACTKVQHGAHWRREEQHKDFSSYLAVGNSQCLFDHSEAASITYLFLQYLIEKILPTVTGVENEQLSSFLSIPGSDPATPHDWKKCCIRTLSRPFNRKESLTLEEVFAITVTFTALHSYWFGFHLYKILRLLHSMRSTPHAFKEAWQFWYAAIQRIKTIGPMESIL